MSAPREPRPDQPCIAIPIGWDVYRVYFHAGAPFYVVRDNRYTTFPTGLALDACAPDSWHRIAAERAVAFLAQHRLPAVAS